MSDNDKLLYDVAIKSYEMEKRREEILNAKAGAIIAADVAVIVAVVEGGISNGGLALISNCMGYIQLITILYIVFDFVVFAVGLTTLFRAFNICDYGGIDLEKTMSLGKESDELRKDVIKHINAVLQLDRKSNSKKAKQVKIGFAWSMIGIGALLLAMILYLLK